MDTEDKKLTKGIIKWTTLSIITVFSLVVVGMVGCPQYEVYCKTKDGEAALKEAESSRQIQQLEALATKNSAADLAAADTIRAHGVARSNQIIGNSLKDNPEYLHWLWIDNIEKNPNAVIYIPTEANLPILESSRLSKQTQDIIGEQNQ